MHYQSANISGEVSSDTEKKCQSGEINIAFMTQEIDKNEKFIAEASKIAVADTACTKPVAGEEWYMNYIKDLACELKSQTKSVEPNTSFKFRDGHKVFSYEKVTLPANIAGINCFIDIELVKVKISLLLSKRSLQKAKAVIDMPSDKITIDLNETISLGLHEINSGLFYFHMIDEFKRYSNAVIIKKKSSSLTAFIKNWLSILGAPERFFSDNGGEFIYQ